MLDIGPRWYIMDSMNDRMLTTGEAGAMMAPERTAQTVRLWCKANKIRHHRDGLTGTILISEAVLRAFCDEHGIVVK
jgi:hypothetical protein